MASDQDSVSKTTGKSPALITVLYLRSTENGLRKNRPLNQGFRPVLQSVLYLVEELMRNRAIDHTVIVAQRHVAHGANGNRIVDHNWTLFDRAQPDNADIGLADHRQAKQASEHAGIGDREGPFLHFFWP